VSSASRKPPIPVEALTFNAPENIEPRDYVVSVPEIRLKSGQRTFVPVSINDATGLIGGGVTLKYDPTVLRAVDVSFPMRQSYEQANTDLPGEVRFAFVNLNGMPHTDKLLLIEFEALPNTDGKTSELILDAVKLSNSLSVQKNHGIATVLPSRSDLFQNYPNPFNPETWLPYQLSDDADVTIEIYSQSGASVASLYLGHQVAGVYTTRTKAAYWDGRNHSGERVSSGVYFYHLKAGDFYATKKMLIVK
jgi:hypothetical protein